MVAASGHLSEYSPVQNNKNERSQYWFEGYNKISIFSLLWDVEEFKSLFADKNDNLKTIAKPAC